MMDQQAASLLATLKRPAAPSQAKLDALNALKSDIKHYRVPENAQATIYECIKLAITQQASASLAGAAFSTLGHLIKRLKIQDPAGVAIVQLSPRLYAAIIERLGDLRETIRQSASSALVELWPFLAQDVEKIVQEDILGGSNPRAKEMAMQWVVRMHKDENMPFKSYVAPMVASVEDADGTVRDAAKNALIELFSDAPDRAKLDLKRQLKAHSVRHAIETQILAQIGSTEAPRQPAPPIDEDAPQVPRATVRSKSRDRSHFAQSVAAETAPPPEPVPMDPIYVSSEREVSDTFRDMVAQFEGKETEQNWGPRDKAVLKIRRMLAGNAPQDYHQAFMLGLKSVLEGVLKVANSLRTTMSTNGCQLIQELARVLGPAMDQHVEVLLQSFIKMSSATKHIAAENGRVTADAILQNCTYHVRMMQHIWGAVQEKNAQLRQCTPQWLTTVLKRQAGYKAHFDSSGGLELAEKCIRKGLDDANPKVKESMRATYWTFAKTWPEKAEAIINKLDPKSRSMLEKDSHNPNAAIFQSSAPSSAVSRATTPHGRSALKDMMAEQRRARSAARDGPGRPTSAMATTTPSRSSANRAPSRLRGEGRVTSNTSTASNATTSTTGKGSSLMSGPVRRPRKQEIQRPLTADPYASRRMLRPETPTNDSVTQSPKGTGASKSSLPVSSANRETMRASVSRETSPALARRHPVGLSSSRPTSRDNHLAPPFGESGHTTSTTTGVRRPPSTLSTRQQEHSTPNGGLLPAMDEEDLSHSRNFSHSRTSSHTLSQASPDVHQSPLKAMIEAARAKLDRPTSSSSSTILSHAPMADPFQEDRPHRGSPARNGDVSIYEDPDQDTIVEQPTVPQQVLSELPVNENVRLQTPLQSPQSTASPSSPQPVHSIPPATPKDRAELQKNRRLLISGIERIRSSSLDAHGFRRVQDLAKMTTDIWDGGEKFDELMQALLAYLSAFEQDSKLALLPSTKAVGLKAQALGIVRALLTVHAKFARLWFDKALVTLLVCRRQVDDSHSHIIADLEKTADDIVRLGPVEACIDAVNEYLGPALEGNSDSPAVAAGVSMALSYLRALVAASQSRRLDIGRSRRLAIAHTASLFLEHGDAEVRKADVDLACQVYSLFTSATSGSDHDTAETEFWGQFDGIDEGRKGLLTYYIARGAKEGQS